MDTTATILHADLDAFYASEASLQGAAPHNGQCDVTAGGKPKGKPPPPAAEAGGIGLLRMEERLKQHAPGRPANSPPPRPPVSPAPPHPSPPPPPPPPA